MGLILILGAGQLSALDAILRSPDQLEVINPAPNSKVKGTINIVWKMYDNDQNVIPYTIHLYDAQTCNVTNYGQINSNPNGISSSTQDNVLSWNTKTTLTNSNIPDGNYCLKLCTAMKEGSNSYSACNGRNIRIVNNNSLPVITSVPSNLIIFADQSWSYQMTATDPDGDKLTYRFISRPPFLDINPQTGLITTNNVNKNPTNSASVKYTVIVAVDDNFSGSVTQQFELTVKKTPSSQTPSEPTPPTPPANTDNPTTLTIESPTSSETVSKSLEISWNVEDSDGIVKTVIDYSQDGTEWTTITTLTDSEITNYEWDTSELTDGTYTVRITVTDTLGNETSKISNEFTVKQEETEPPIESVPLIINVSPLNDSEIDSKTPTISGEFVPSEGAEIDPMTFQITLDDVNIEQSCVVDSLGFSCRVTSDLEPGLHKVYVAIGDSAKKTNETEWNFTVTGEEPPVSYTGDYIPIFGIDVPRGSLILGVIVCLIVFGLLIVPWILYILWTRRNRNNAMEDLPSGEGEANPVNTEYGYYLPPYNPIPADQTYTPTPEVIIQPQQATEVQPKPMQEVVEAPMEQAEPKLDMSGDTSKPVLPEQNADLAKEEAPLAPIDQSVPNEAPLVEDQFKLPETNEPLSQPNSSDNQTISTTPNQNGEDEFVEPEVTG